MWSCRKYFKNNGISMAFNSIVNMELNPLRQHEYSAFSAGETNKHKMGIRVVWLEFEVLRRRLAGCVESGYSVTGMTS